MSTVRCVIVGSGVIGVSCARSLSLAGIETLNIEKHSSSGAETSSRNSEVIHAGMYYPSGSAKAKLCVDGGRQLYDYLRDRAIPFSKCGKLIIASTEQEKAKLQLIHQRGVGNGVKGLRLLTGEEVSHLEPEISCSLALLSEETGIFESSQFLSSCEDEATQKGAMFLVDCSVNSAKVNWKNGKPGFVLDTDQGSVECEFLINCAGLGSTFFAKRIEGYPIERVPKAYFAKGNYFKLIGSKSPFRHLIYPIPCHGGLGVHATLDMANRMKFGPDVEWLTEDNLSNDNSDDGSDEAYVFRRGPPGIKSYVVDERRKCEFAKAIRSYWPAISEDRIDLDYSGIRPKLLGPNMSKHAGGGLRDAFGRDLSDFVIEGPRNHGVAGLVNLFGIESPGLTSSLAIGQYVARLLQE